MEAIAGTTRIELIKAAVAHVLHTLASTKVVVFLAVILGLLFFSIHCRHLHVCTRYHVLKIYPLSFVISTLMFLRQKNGSSAQ